VVNIFPSNTPSVEDVLYGDRTTSYRWEVFSHANGVDHLVGVLDGVFEGSLSWTYNTSVKGTGKATLIDLDVVDTTPGLLRVADLTLESVRLRPVQVIQGLPENPLGIFLVSAADEDWEDTGRTYALELLDKCTVLDQDLVDESYSVAAGTKILPTVQAIVASAGEYLAIDASVTTAVSTGQVWDAGTSKLNIINDLLSIAGYSALWMDGYGNFQATPSQLPADRDLSYALLGLPRELRDGEQSIYSPSWTRTKDSYSVPNKVLAIQAAGGTDDPAIVGEWTNQDPTSPYSYQSRGRWITYVVDGVEVPDGTAATQLAFLQSRAQTTLVQMSAVQASIKLTHLPIPLVIGDVLQFSNTDAGIDTQYQATSMALDTTSTGLMKTTLQEVISL